MINLRIEITAPPLSNYWIYNVYKRKRCMGIPLPTWQLIRAVRPSTLNTLRAHIDEDTFHKSYTVVWS